jgi:MinD superfamily P-loop ATPase
MKSILVISGKGGTGKTMLAASFAALAKSAVIADCDVDAADMHLMLNPVIKDRHDFFGGKKAFIEKPACIKCNKCVINCRFEAISRDFVVNPMNCEGCGLCFQLCPAEAIRMNVNKAGEWFVSATPYGALIHAKLGAGEDNSGKLVTIVRKETEKIAAESKARYIIIDGPPGIGCPVMAAITGVDMAVVVTEPTVSGAHDFIRLIETIGKFKIKTGLVVNKYDINPEKSAEIEKTAKERNVDVLGRIPYSKSIVDAVVKGVPPSIYCTDGTGNAITGIWHKTLNNIMEEK